MDCKRCGRATVLYKPAMGKYCGLCGAVQPPTKRNNMTAFQIFMQEWAARQATQKTLDKTPVRVDDDRTDIKDTLDDVNEQIRRDAMTFTNNQIRAAFATIANNTGEEHTRKFALEWFQKIASLVEVHRGATICKHGIEPYDCQVCFPRPVQP